MREKFLKIFANLPIAVRSEIIAVLDEQPMTWNVCYLEVKGKTKLGDRILKYLTKLEFI